MRPTSWRQEPVTVQLMHKTPFIFTRCYEEETRGRERSKAQDTWIVFSSVWCYSTLVCKPRLDLSCFALSASKTLFLC